MAADVLAAQGARPLDAMTLIQFSRNILITASEELNPNLAKSHLSTPYIDGLMQERHNSNANALELCFSCNNPLTYQLLAWHQAIT